MQRNNKLEMCLTALKKVSGGTHAEEDIKKGKNQARSEREFDKIPIEIGDCHKDGQGNWEREVGH